MKTQLAAFSFSLALFGGAGAVQADAVRLTETQMDKLTAGHKTLTLAQVPTKPGPRTTARHYGEFWRYIPGLGWGLFRGWHTDRVTWASTPSGFGSFTAARAVELQLDPGVRAPANLPTTVQITTASGE